MFEDYLEDTYYFVIEASKKSDLHEAKRYYRVAIFCLMSAIEAFVNYIVDILVKAEIFELYEISFLTDKKFDISSGKFQILEQKEFHRLEDKIKFLLKKFVPDFNFECYFSWGSFIELKKIRDELTHPRQEEDDTDIEEYEKKVKSGLSSVIDIINDIYKGTLDKSLRKKILDLKLD